MRYVNLFFDLDGTLIDSFEGCADSFQAVFDHFGLDISREESRRFIGPPLQTTFSKLVSADRVAEAVEVYRDYYLNHGGQWNVKLFDGVPDMLREIKAQGYRMYVATSKGENAAIEILEHFGVAKYFDRIFGADYRVGRVEKEEVLRYAFDELSCEPNESLMIGDSVYDATGASIMNMACLACAYGFGSVEEMRSVGIVGECDSPESVALYLSK